MTRRARSAKDVVFVAFMGALGNVLSGLSIAVAPIVPSIPLGPVSFSLNIDLSHITTFIAALFGGPDVGGLTGLIGGLVAANEFGFSKGNLITGFALPVGKALTGITAGLIMRSFDLMAKRRRLLIPASVVSYIPEGVYTALIFIIIFPPVLGLPLWLVKLITAQTLVKAFVEMIVIGLIITTLCGNRGFTEYIELFFVE